MAGALNIKHQVFYPEEATLCPWVPHVWDDKSMVPLDQSPCVLNKGMHGGRTFGVALKRSCLSNPVDPGPWNVGH